MQHDATTDYMDIMLLFNLDYICSPKYFLPIFLVHCNLSLDSKRIKNHHMLKCSMLNFDLIYQAMLISHGIISCYLFVKYTTSI